MIITISGTAGSGKSTIAKYLAKKLKYEYFSFGKLFREMAKKHNMNVYEFDNYARKHKEIHYELDEYQKKLSKTKENLVMDSRLGFYLVPNSIKIFVDADLETRAKRVFKDKRTTEKLGSLEKTKQELLLRDKLDRETYIKLYKVDIFDKRNYDILIDSTELSVEEIVNNIVNIIKIIK